MSPHDPTLKKRNFKTYASGYLAAWPLSEVLSWETTLPRLDARLKLVAQQIRSEVHADVGSDHGHLLKALIRSGRVESGIAIENKSQPLANSLATLEGLPVDVRQADGLDGVQAGEVDSLSICGMGGEAICRILSRHLDRIPKLVILQPNQDARLVRSWAQANGLLLIDEQVTECRRMFLVLRFERGEDDAGVGRDPAYDGLDLEAAIWFGPHLIRRWSPTFVARLQDEHRYLTRLPQLSTESASKLECLTRLLGCLLPWIAPQRLYFYRGVIIVEAWAFWIHRHRRSGCLAQSVFSLFPSFSPPFVSSSSDSIPLSRRWRLVLSCLLLVHLAAVFLPPMAFQARGSRGISPSITMLLEPIAGYCQFLYLDRGYAFFAPDPGPSHLVRAKMTSGSERLYPNLDDQWPRLLYHRHFMLAEFLNESYQPALPVEASRLVGPAITAEELQAWRLGRKRYEAIEASMTKHVQHTFADSAATLQRVEHTIPDFVLLMNTPIPLTDERLYVTLEDIPITLEALTDGLPNSLPNPNVGSPQDAQPSRASEPFRPKVTEPVPAPAGERDPLAGIPITENREKPSEPEVQDEPVKEESRDGGSHVTSTDEPKLDEPDHETEAQGETEAHGETELNDEDSTDDSDVENPNTTSSDASPDEAPSPVKASS